ncbi:MAG: hypothetical protein FJ387_16115 [Verrucomicrobia bacterium]|nr:hypothetical protein [Verrucomicrobiota bacterium]
MLADLFPARIHQQAEAARGPSQLALEQVPQGDERHIGQFDSRRRGIEPRFGWWTLDFGFRTLDFGFRISDFGFDRYDHG